MNIKITVLIVTYGDRSNYLTRVLKSLKSVSSIENISEIIIIDNGSSVFEIEFIEILTVRIHVIRNKINLGSAGGIKVGFDYINNNLQDRFILILDDDNVVDEKFIENTIKKFSCLVSYLKIRESDCWRIALRSNRINRGESEENITRNSEVDSFCDFRFFSKKTKLFSITEYPETLTQYQSSPWGGLFMHQNVIREIGVPIANYFIYGDDFEYSSRMSKMGIKIFLNKDAIISDICVSSDRNNKIHRYFQKNYSPDLLYYQIRNHAHACSIHKVNNIRFIANIIGFITLNTYRWLNKPLSNFSRYKIIIVAIKDGLTFKLAKNHFF